MSSFQKSSSQSSFSFSLQSPQPKLIKSNFSVPRDSLTRIKAASPLQSTMDLLTTIPSLLSSNNKMSQSIQHSPLLPSIHSPKFYASDQAISTPRIKNIKANQPRSNIIAKLKSLTKKMEGFHLAENIAKSNSQTPRIPSKLQLGSLSTRYNNKSPGSLATSHNIESQKLNFISARKSSETEEYQRTQLNESLMSRARKYPMINFYPRSHQQSEMKANNNRWKSRGVFPNQLLVRERQDSEENSLSYTAQRKRVLKVVPVKDGCESPLQVSILYEEQRSNVKLFSNDGIKGEKLSEYMWVKPNGKPKGSDSKMLTYESNSSGDESSRKLRVNRKYLDQVKTKEGKLKRKVNKIFEDEKWCNVQNRVALGLESPKHYFGSFFAVHEALEA